MSDGAAAAGIMGILGMACLVGVAIALIPAIFYILTIKKAFDRIAPARREMEGNMAWLLLIPLFGAIWHFFIVIKLTSSFAKEFEARGLQTDDPKFGFLFGILGCALPFAGWIPILGILTSLGWLVCIILWWVKVANYSKQLA